MKSFTYQCDVCKNEMGKRPFLSRYNPTYPWELQVKEEHKQHVCCKECAINIDLQSLKEA